MAPRTKKRRIGVDLLLLSQFSYTGMVTFVHNILPRLIAAIPEHEWVLFARSPQLGFDYSQLSNVRVKQTPWMRSEWLWKVLGVSAESITEGLDLLFMPASRMPPIKQCPVAVVVYDLGFASLPEYLKRGSVSRTAFSVKDAVKRSDVIFTISHFMKQQISNTYGIPDEKIVVTPCAHRCEDFNAAEVSASDADAIVRSYGIQRPYALYVGIIQGRKNLLKLIDAYDKWRVRIPDLRLVLSGKRGWNCEDIYKRAARYQPSEVRMTGPIKQEHLRVVYQMAECYILPSLYEGFGIPVLEAMACGTPTILSTAGSLPEVGGNAALYFDPSSADEIAEKVIRLHNSLELRNQLKQEGQMRAAQFTWDSGAHRIADALQDLLSD